jgi:hypothetical protein
MLVPFKLRCSRSSERLVQTLMEEPRVCSLVKHVSVRILRTGLAGCSVFVHSSRGVVGCPNKLSGIYSPDYFATSRHPVVSAILRAQRSSFSFLSRGTRFCCWVFGFSAWSNSTLLHIPSTSTTRSSCRLSILRGWRIHWNSNSPGAHDVHWGLSRQ